MSIPVRYVKTEHGDGIDTPRYVIDIKPAAGSWFDILLVPLAFGPCLAIPDIGEWWMKLLLATLLLLVSWFTFVQQRRHALGTRIHFYSRDRIVVLSWSGRILAEGEFGSLHVRVGARDSKTYFQGDANGFFIVELKRGEESILQRFGVVASGASVSRPFDRNRYFAVAIVILAWSLLAVRWLS